VPQFRGSRMAIHFSNCGAAPVTNTSLSSLPGDRPTVFFGEMRVSRDSDSRVKDSDFGNADLSLGIAILG
jgi:hypothetical protein